MRAPFPEPTHSSDSRAQVLSGYLDYFRGVVVTKLEGLRDDQLRASLLPSGWTPLELLKHLVFMERRWVVWGFLGEDVTAPWGDSQDGRWCVDPAETSAELVAELEAQATRTRLVVDAHPLDERGQPGERWSGAQPASLERVLLHVVQEYARHVGHLDIVRELTDAVVGE